MLLWVCSFDLAALPPSATCRVSSCLRKMIKRMHRCLTVSLMTMTFMLGYSLHQSIEIKALGT